MTLRMRSAPVLLAALGLLAGGGTAVAALPDGRAYELVTPGAEKGAGEVAPRFMQISPDGDRIAYTVNGVFGDDPTHAMTALGVGTTYIAERDGDGWKSRFRADVPLPPFVSQDVFDLTFLGASADVSRVFYTLTYGAATGFTTGVYAENGDGTTDLLGARPASGNAPRYLGSSRDGSHVVLWANRRGALAPIPGNPVMNGALLYERVGTEIRLVNATNTGEVLNILGGTFGSTIGSAGTSGGTTTTARNAISADGSRIFFASRLPGALGADPFHLFVRINGQETVQLSASVHSDPQPAPAAVSFAGASADGTKIFFTTTGQLTDDATGAGPFLYQYDLPAAATRGTLSLIAGVDSPVHVTTDGRPIPQVVVSDDGSHVYFRADADGGSIFVYDTATRATTLVARGVGTTARLQSARGDVNARDFAEASTDGTSLVFVTTADLLPQDTYAGRQIYAYDVADGLRLVSGSAVAPATFDAEFLTNDGDIADFSAQAFTSPDANYVSDDGQYVFFQTKAALAPEDTNQVTDVYRERDGAVELISDGTRLSASYLVGASADGTSVAFLTQGDLLPRRDGDDSWDVYSARIGGGFADPTLRQPCVADACQPAPTPTPFLPVPATGTFNGPGNVEEPETPEATFAVGKVSAAAKRTLARKGRVTIVVRTSTAGMVAGKLSARFGKRWAGVDTAVARTGKAGSVKLRLALSPKAKRYLRTHRRGMSVRVDVTYSASDEGRRAAFVIRPAASKRGAR